MKSHYYIKLLISTLFLFLSLSTKAAHFRGGKIEWSRSASSPLTVNFKIYAVWKFDDLQSLTFNFGDGTSTSILGTEVLFVDGYKVLETTISHTYPSSANYTASYGTCCRISNTVNSADQNFLVSSLVCLSGTNYNSPKSTSPFVIEMTQGTNNQIQLSGNDDDGVPVSFSTAVISGSSYIPSAGGNTLAVSSSGLVNWNTSGASVGQLYQFKVKMGDGCAESELDLLVKIVTSTCPTPSAIISGNSTITPGQNAVITVQFTGAAPWDYNISGVGAGSTSSNPLILNVSPSVTTNYSINSVSNGCGIGSSSGIAKVVVCNSANPATAIISGSTTIGNGQSTNLTINFTGNGPWGFSLNNSQAGAFSSSSQTTVSVSPVINTTYTITTFFDACGTGTTSGTAVVNICQSPTASISGSQTISSGQIANLSVSFTGQGPWNYNISNFGTGTTSLNPLTIGVNPTITTTYSLISVSNACSSGTVSGSATVSICGGNLKTTISGGVSHAGVGTNLSLNSSAGAPFNYDIQGVGSGVANTNPFLIPVNPNETKLYTLISSSSGCGTHSLSGPALVTVQSQPVTKKLVSCIPFSGNFNDGKNVNTVTNSGVTLAQDRFGTPNEAGYFNGSSFLSLSSTDILNQEYTYSAWINPTVLPLNGQINTLLSIGGVNGDQILSISYNYSDNTTKPVWGLGSFISSGSAISATYANDDIIANNWYFITAKRTFDSVEIYIDGVSKIKRYTGGNNPYYGGSNVVLGARYSGSQNFTGIIDDFKIFRGALSPNEIKILYFNKTCDFEYQQIRKIELISCFPFSGNSNDNKNSQDAINTNAVLVNDRFGNTNSAFSFNGTAEMTIPSSHILTNTFTYSSWFKASTSSAVNTIFSVGNGTSSQFLGIVNNSSTGNLPSLQFISSLNSSNSISLVANNFTLNTWNHVVAIREPQRIKLYLNGVLIGERSTLNVAAAYYGTNPILAKIGSNASSQRFIGDLDDIKIYNGALFDAEVMALYQETSTNCIYNSCPPILLINNALSGTDSKKASSFIESKSNINSPSNVNYFAGKSITLTPGFNTAISTVFKAEISGCFVPTATPPVINNILTLQPGPTDGNDGEVSSVVPNNTSTNNVFIDPLAYNQANGTNIKRCFIKFDLSTLPNNAVIDSAKLNLYFSQALINQFPNFTGHEGDNVLNIRRVTSTWDESTLNWNNQPSVSNSNLITIPKAISAIQNYLNIDVKILLSDMLNSTNFGFSIVHALETPNKITCLTTSEEVNPAIRPKLVIYYH